MAVVAGGREANLGMVGIIGGVVLRGVAAIARIGGIVVVPVVAGGTVIGDARMCPGQRPEVIMNGEGGGEPVGVGRMAQSTIGRQSQVLVIGIGTRIIIGCMATGTSVRCVVVIPLVATVAVHIFMGSFQRPEAVVINCCGDPTILIVADHAISGEAGILVVRVAGLVVVRGMAPVTGVRRVVVIPVVAGRAVVGYGRVRSIEWPEVVVDGEGGRHPVRVGRMAQGTVCRESERLMVGIGAGIIVRGMATGAGIGRVVVVAVVAGRTIIGDRQVPSVQDPVIVMDGEGGRTPSRRRGMAGCTVRWEVECGMVGVGRLVVIRQVASLAGVRGIVIVAGMTSGTVVGDGQVRSIQHPEVVVVRELGRAPPRVGGVALCTIRPEVEGDMVWIGRLVEVGHMTGIAVGRRALVPGGMAGGAIDGDMRAGQWEVGQAMVEGIIGITGRMTGVTGIAVVGISGDALVIIVRLRIQVTPGTAKFRVVVGIDMAFHTLRPFALVLAAVDREILGIVIEVGRDPGILGMAAGAIRRELGCYMVRVLGVVEIVAVAPEAGVGRVVVIPVMAGGAIITDTRMRPNERIEIIVDGEGGRHPVRGGGMA